MGIDFERGAFANPDTPWYDDDVDSAIVIVTNRRDRGAALRAVERCIDRWWGIDGAGRHHGSDDQAFSEGGSSNLSVGRHLGAVGWEGTHVGRH